ncbi:hypothetical protein HYV50_00700 [Candidatus Pacearchaeota archaeon]|nr:hypothetical protein [Candidatus Pacearchaeota archaeon]
MKKRRKNKFEKKFRGIYFYILFLIAVIIVFFSVLLWVSGPIETKEFDVRFSVKNEVGGFDLNGTALTYGIIPLGGAGVRTVIIGNYHEFPVEVKILANREIFDFIDAPEKIFLGAGEEKNVTIRIEIPEDAEEKEYNGKIRFDTYSLKNIK